jgi:hypothetical protein
VEKTKQKYVLPKWIKCNIITKNLFLERFKVHMTFLFCDKEIKGWVATKASHYWFVWSNKVTSQSLAINLTILLDEYRLKKEILIYVQHEGSNLNIVTFSLKFTMNCKCLGLEENFQGICLGMFFLKLVNMQQHMKHCAKISSMFLLILLDHILLTMYNLV